MKRILIIYLSLIASVTIFGSSVFTQSSESVVTGDEFSRSIKVKLFNGKNLDGWYTFLKERGRNNDPKNVFTIQKDVLRITGEEWGYLMTNDEYENYMLEIEYKWGVKTFEPRLENARDCGILIHSQGEDGALNGIWMHSIECNIIEGGSGDFVVVADGSENFAVTCPVAPDKQRSSYVFQPDGELVTINRGRINWFGRDPDWQDVKDFRGKNDIEKPLGKWNKMKIIAKGKEIYIYLNGVLVNHAVEVRPSKGRIQIQSESAEIFFRRIDLTPLSQY